MLLAKVFERFVAKTPVSVMARAAMEHALAPETLDELFEEHADKQYTRELLFSADRKYNRPFRRDRALLLLNSNAVSKNGCGTCPPVSSGFQ